MEKQGKRILWIIILLLVAAAVCMLVQNRLLDDARQSAGELNLRNTGLREKLTEAQTESDALTAELEEIKVSLSGAQTEAEAARAEAEAARAALETTRLALENAQLKAQTAQQALKTAEDENAAVKAELETVRSEAESTQADLTAAKQSAEAMQAQLNDIQTALIAARAELESAEALHTVESQEHQAALTAAQTDAKDAHSALLAAQEELADLKQQLESLSTEPLPLPENLPEEVETALESFELPEDAEDLQVQIAVLEAELAYLTDALTQYERVSGANSVLGADIPAQISVSAAGAAQLTVCNTAPPGMHMTVRLSLGGESLGEAMLKRPGEILHEIPLTAVPAPGTEVLLEYIVLDADENPVSALRAPVTIG